MRYRYEEMDAKAASGEMAAQPQGEREAALLLSYQDLVQRLQQMDSDWLHRLEHATVLGEQQIILDLVNEIVPEDAHLAARIASLAEKFDHDRILALIEEAQRNTHAAG